MTNLDFKTIGRKIRERRISQGLTQEFVAQQLDVNPSHISNIEGGRANPSLTALVKIANTLCCSVDCFLSEEYVFTLNSSDSENLDDRISNKLKYRDKDTKLKILKIIDIL